MTFGRVIFGDNQFLGVNHSSPDKALALDQRFANPDAVLEVIGWAHEAGIRDFMFTTHDRLYPAFREIVRSSLFPGMRYIPCMPYAHKYVDTLNAGGMKAVMQKHFRGHMNRRLLGGLARFGVGDFAAGMQLLVEIELLMTMGLNVKGAFLLNIVFDLIVGMRAQTLLERYHRYVSDRLKATPGYITMNHPMAQKALCDEIGVESPWICANFNQAGFRVNPSLAEVEASFSNGRSKNIAMSVFASGVLRSDAMQYVSDFKGVDSILFGSSRRENIDSNVALIRGERSPA